MHLQFSPSDGAGTGIPDIISIWVANYGATGHKHHNHWMVGIYKNNGIGPAGFTSNKSRNSIPELPKIKCGDNLERKDIFTIWLTFIESKTVINRTTEVGVTMVELERFSVDKAYRFLHVARPGASNDQRAAETVAEERNIEKDMKKGELNVTLLMPNNGLAVNGMTGRLGLSEKRITALG